MARRRAKLKTTGRTWIVGTPQWTGSEEENIQRKNSGKIFYSRYDTNIYYGSIERNGKPWGATRSFWEDELEFID